MSYGYARRYFSYNSLTVPLDIGTWQCTLLLRRDYAEQARQWKSSRDRDRRSSSEWARDRPHSRSGSIFDDRDDEAAEKRQREDDVRAFALYFRPNYDFRRLIHTDIDAIMSFVSEFLNVAHWNLPTDNAGVERLLKQAVGDGRLVPIIDRDRRTPARTFRPAPAPLRWLSDGGSGEARPAYLFPPGTTAFDGEPVLSGPYNPASQVRQGAALRTSASSDAAGGSFDWLGAAETAVETVLRHNEGPDEFASDADDDTSMQFADAQPFEYTPDAPSGDVEELAASTRNPDYAAKMLGYERDVFGDMIHAMKDANKLGGADNVIWHDNGDVYFNGKWLDNMRNY